MTDKITKLQRWIDLIAFLASHRYAVSLEQISRNVPSYRALRPEDGSGVDPSVQRRFERDKSNLRQIGIEIVSETRSGESYYRLRMDQFTLPTLRLVAEAQLDEGGKRPGRPGPFTFEIEERDAKAVVSGLRLLAEQPGSPLRAAARSALQKLSFDLPADVVENWTDPSVTDTVVQIEDPEAQETTEFLKVLQDALRARKTVHMRYRSMRRGTEGWRSVDPFGLLSEGGRWYLIGRDHDANDARMFRVGRILEVKTEAKQARVPDFDIPKDFRIADWAGRHPWQYGSADLPTEEVRVLFRFPRSRWAERNRFGTFVSENPDGDQERSFEVRDPEAFARWVLGMAGGAAIVSPPHMVERLRELARTLQALHRSGGQTRRPELQPREKTS
jgi:predicted DNA-binding transcriptional regulator YafY